MSDLLTAKDVVECVRQPIGGSKLCESTGDAVLSDLTALMNVGGGNRQARSRGLHRRPRELSRCEASTYWSMSRCNLGRAYLSVRFENLLASGGSVLRLFRKPINQGGPVTITHPEVTRFLMTIPEASKPAVLACALASHDGEVLVRERCTHTVLELRGRPAPGLDWGGNDADRDHRK